jgi:hypothetical protein
MSSSRSVAAARARRANPEPPQQNYSKGPVTSINSQSSFSTTTGAASRVSGSSRPSQQQSAQQPQSVDASAKLSVTNVISLMSLRLGRLEAFVHQYNLDKSNGADNTVSHGSNSNTRADDAVIRNIITRLEGLEKSKQVKRDDQDKAHNEPSTETITTINKMTEDVDNLYDEIEDIKDLLLKLQSFTMETNQKLVNVMFQDTNQMQIETLDQPDYASVEINELGSSQMLSGNLKDMINQELAESL